LLTLSGENHLSIVFRLFAASERGILFTGFLQECEAPAQGVVS